MDLEMLSRYRALKARWKVLDQTMVVSGDPFLGRVPDYMSAAEDEEAPVSLTKLDDDDSALLTILDFPAKVCLMMCGSYCSSYYGVWLVVKCCSYHGM